MYRASTLSKLAHSTPSALQSPITAAARSAQIPNHFSISSKVPTMPTFGVRKIGAPNTLEHRVYIEMDGKVVSPFHDIPLYANEQQTILNMVVVSSVYFPILGSLFTESL